MKKVLFTSVFALALVGCVTASEVSTLVPQSINSVDSSSKLSQAVSVESLSAEASGAYKNQVSDEALASALKEALSQNGMLATEGAAYTVIPNVVDLKQPAIGIDMKVTATVNYIVKDESGKIVMDKTIATPYTAKMSEAFVGATRVKRANEGAVRENISAFIADLTAWADSPEAIAFSQTGFSVAP